MSCRLTSITIAATLLLAAIPALADPALSPQKRLERIRGCIITHGEHKRDWCVETIEGPDIIGYRALREYLQPDPDRAIKRAIEREIRCRDIPGKKSPTDCFFD